MCPNSAATLDKLRIIKQRFAEGLGSRQSEMQASFDLLQQQWNSENLDTIYRQLHSLKGAAATFGFSHISHQARRIEQSLDRIKCENSDGQGLQDLASQLSRLYQLMQNPVTDISTSPASTLSLLTEQLTILLAEDDDSIREQLVVILEASGHRVIQAANGEEACELFNRIKPDLVILDVIMPVMDGYTAAQKIKKDSGNHFMPIIFLTALSSDEELVRCVESGGDDFLVKPVNSELLNARIFAMQRIKHLHQELEEYQRRTEMELELGRYIFQSIIDRNPKDIAYVHYWLNPAGHFSGDMISFQQHQDDDLYILIGDFTGHGLAAATGAIPAADVFYATARKGIALAEIAATLNNKLHQLLPTSNFFACVLLRYRPKQLQLEILNCGLPPVYLIDKQGALETIKSSQLSLGILPDTNYSDAVVSLDTARFSQLLAYTDGVTELQNGDGEMLGQAALEQQLLKFSAIDNQHLIQHLRNELKRYQNTEAQADDITLLHLNLDSHQA